MSDQEQIRVWCENQNTQDSYFARSVWYYAMADDRGSVTAHRVEGLDAEEVRKAARGDLPNYAGWSRFNMQKHIGLVKYRLSMGMTQSSFDRLLDRWREKWRESKDFGQHLEKSLSQAGGASE